MIKLLMGALGGIWGYVAAAVVAAALAGSATYFVEHSVEERKILALELKASQQKAVDVSKALSQLEGFISTAQAASDHYGGTVQAINLQYAALLKGLRDAVKIPLPIDCRPDPGRVRVLESALAAANAANSRPAK